MVSECTKSDAFTLKYGGILCDPSVQVRRVSWWRAAPTGNFMGQEIKIALWDDSIFSGMTDEEKQAYQDDGDNYSAIKFDDMGQPDGGWHVPFVTGHKYKVSWGASGLDFEEMWVYVEQNWESGDEPIHFVHNHTDIRFSIINSQYMSNWTMIKELDEDSYLSTSKWENGAFHHDGDEDVQLFSYLVTGEDRQANVIKIVGSRCDGVCLDDINGADIDETILLWSEDSTWELDDFTKPAEGEDVKISASRNIYYDLPIDDDLPSFGNIEI